MDLMQDIIARAKADKQRIVLPEGTEERTLKAADRLLADGVADIILIGNPAEIKELAAGFGLNHIGEATLVDPKNHEKKAAYADLLFQLRQKKGMTPEKAAVLVEDPLFLACLMIKAGDADGEIAGAENTTGNVLRPALQIIKTAPGMKCVSVRSLCSRRLLNMGMMVFWYLPIVRLCRIRMRKSWLASLSLPPLRLVIS